MPDNNLGNFEININANTGGVEQSLNQIGQGMDDVKKKGQGIDQPVQSLKQALREANLEAQRMAVQFGRNSTQFVEAARNVAEIKSEFEKYKQSVEAFNPENKLAGFVSVASGATMAVRGWTGAMELLGVESDKSTAIIQKMMALREVSEALKSYSEIKTAFQSMGSMLGFVQQKSAAATKQIAEQTVATEGAAVAAETQTVATEAQAVATEGATVATKGLGLAFKAIGIGLIIAAVAALVEHWDDIKESLAKVFPWINQVGDGFNKFKEIAVGVGNVMLKSIVAPFKLVMGVIQGFMSGGISGAIDGAKKALADGYNIIDNFEEGRKMQKKRNDDNDRKEALKAAIEKADREIEVIKASGEESYKEERKNLVRKLELAKLEKKGVEKAQNDLEVLDAAHAKKVADDAEKAKTKRKQDEDKLKQERAAALKEVESHYRDLQKIIDDAHAKALEASMTARQKEIDQSDVHFKTSMKQAAQSLSDELAKLKDAHDNGIIEDKEYYAAKIKLQALYDQAAEDLAQENNQERLAIEKKYHELVLAYITDGLKTTLQAELDAEDKKYQEALKNAQSFGEKLAIIGKHNENVDNITKKNEIHNNVVNSETKVSKAVSAVENTDSTDPAEIKRLIDERTKAELEAEDNAFKEKTLNIKEENAEYANLAQLHADKITAIKKKGADDGKKIDNAEKDSKLQLLQAIGGAIGNLGALFKKGTAASKAAALADIAINTAVGFIQGLDIAQKGAKATGAAAPYAFPIFYASQVAAVLGAVASAKSVLSAGTGDSGGSIGSAPQIDTAPIINAVDLSGQNQGPQDVRVVNPQNQAIKAYITPRDLQDHEDQKNFMNKLSSF